MNKVIALIAIAVVVIAGWLMFKDAGIPTGVESLNPVVNTGTENENTQATGVVREFTITSEGLVYNPKQIEVNEGDTVKITYVNTLGFHDLVIDEYNVATKQLPAGQSEVVTFVADKAGTFEYYCSVGTHRQQGMWGTLTVK